MPAPGQRLGPYELRRRLGKGGSADVWEALLHGPGGFAKPVALKMLHGARAAVDRDRTQLLREARTGARLQHPGVVSTLLVGEHDDVLCIALELVRGRTASQLLRTGGPLPGRALLDLGVQVAEALHHVHTARFDGLPAGLVHRDVKPSNLLVDRRGQVKLADLGIAHALGTRGPSSGTPGYVPPEQIEGQAEPRSDLFALGVTLYVLATRRMPFGTGSDALEAVYGAEARLREADLLPPLDEVVPGLADVVRSCLRFDPDQRPADAATLAASLAALRHGAPGGPPLGALVVRAAPELDADPAVHTDDDATVALPSGNLRPPRDAFVGRTEELAALTGAVQAHRWVVLLGPGGMGKTRLALQLLHRLQRELVGGAWAFDLTEARTAEGICAAVAGALGLPLDPADPVQQLGRLFGSRGPSVVLLDNLEQCVDALPTTLGVWRELAPEARFVGTSRVRPGLRDEKVVPLGELAAADAERLFVARAVRPLQDDERAELPALCAELEHVPLSLELAAARLRLLDVSAMRERLSMALLARGGGDRPARHRSVQASLQWSWELLDDHAATALAQLSVFDGGFDLAAAEAVLDLGPAGPWALDVLEELVDASLVRVDPHTGRFGMWSVVRAFGASKLDPEARRSVELRHGEHFAQLAARSQAAPADVDNLVGACLRAAARADARVAVATLEAAGRILEQQGPCGRWVDMAQAVVALPLPPHDAARARGLLGRALWRSSRLAEAARTLQAALRETPADDRRTEAWLQGTLGAVLYSLGRMDEARAALDASLATSIALGDRTQEANARGMLGMVLVRRGRLKAARAQAEGALAIHRELGNRRFEGHQLGNLGLVAGMEGRLEDARQHFEEALRIHRHVGDRRAEAIALTNLGALLSDLGDDDEALRTLQQARVVQRAVGNRRIDGVLLGNLGNLHLWRGRLPEARRCYEAALAVHREVGSCGFEGVALSGMGDLLAAEGDPEAAETRYHEAVAILQEVGDTARLGRTLLALARLEAARGALDDAWARGEAGLAHLGAADDPEMLAEGLAAWAEVCAHAGQTDEAQAAIDEALATVPSSQPGAAARLMPARERVRRLLSGEGEGPGGGEVS